MKNAMNFRPVGLMLLFCLIPLWAFAQSVMVKGVVKDTSGEAIIGASVLEKGTTNGTITDFDGNFALNVSKNAVLVVSFVGYKNEEIPVAGQSSLKITLKEDSKALEEVVVIGYGSARKSDVTGSIASVGGEKLREMPATNITYALQNRVAGVDMAQTSSAPGASMQIRIRGTRSLNASNDPLVVLDGIPFMGNLSDINPGDIKSMDILKDASATAVFGVRGANGVILITTHKGAQGSPARFTYNGYAGMKKVFSKYPMMNGSKFAEMRKLAGKFENSVDESDDVDTDWQDLMFGPALMQNYALSVKGGGKYSTYYNSVGYTNQDGVMKGTNYQRYTLQSKQDFKKGIFQAGTNVVLTYDQSNPLYSVIRGGMVGHTLQAIPTWEQYDENRTGGYGGLYGDVVNLTHPLGMVDDNLMKRYSDNVKIFANAYVSVELMKGLKYKLNLTPDFQFYRYNSYEGLFDFGLAKHDITAVTEQQTRTRNILVENLLTFDRTFGDHKVSALVGYTYQDSRYRYMQGSGQGMPTGITEIDAASQGLAVSGNSSRSVLTSILGRAFYSYKNRYLLTATIRRDGSSKFGSNYRYGNFPSVSVGWNIAEEDFVKNSVSWLDQLKLRGGYGVLGNQEIDNYQYVSVVTTGINYPDGKSGLIQGAFPKTFANPDIKWEETAMTNVGIDFMALRNRLTLTADWYVKNTKDILLNVPIPISTGGANDPIRNAGKIRNQGFEFNLGWNESLNKDLSYGVSFLGTYNKNEVVEMGAESQVITGGTIHGGTYTSRTLAGYPIGGFWLIPTDGYFNSTEEVQAHQKDGVLIQPSAEPGDIRFKDTNNDGTINDEDRVYCGSPFPKFTYSINGNITYKNVDFSIGFQGVTGNKIYNATKLELTDVTRGTNYLASTLDYWTPENQNASSPRLIWTDPNRNARSESDRYLESGSYFRLRNLQVGYTLPTVWFHGFVQKARVYVNAENLFTISSYSGYTPDVNSSDVYSRGFDEFIYPSNRTFMFGLNVTF